MDIKVPLKDCSNLQVGCIPMVRTEITRVELIVLYLMSIETVVLLDCFSSFQPPTTVAKGRARQTVKMRRRRPVKKEKEIVDETGNFSCKFCYKNFLVKYLLEVRTNEGGCAIVIISERWVVKVYFLFVFRNTKMFAASLFRVVKTCGRRQADR